MRKFYCISVGVLALSASACKPTPPIVVVPKSDSSTNGTDVHVEAPGPTLPPPVEEPKPRTGVDVRVGGQNGVDVQVGPREPVTDPPKN